MSRFTKLSRRRPKPDRLLAGFVLVLSFCLLLAAPARAFTLTPEEIETLRDEIRRNIQSSNGFINTISGVINATLTPDLSSAHFKISNPDDSETSFSTIKLPYYRHFNLEGKSYIPYLGGVVGYLSAEEQTAYTSPTFGQTIDLDIKWQGLSAMIEGGVKFPLGRGLYVSPGLGLGYARLRNRTAYNNEFSRDVAQPVLDGLTANYDLNAALVAGVVALGYEKSFNSLDFNAVAKYAHSFIQTFGVVEDVHRFSDNTDTIAGRAALGGPFNFKLALNPLSWEVFTSGLVLAGPGDGEVGFHYYLEVGGTVGMDISGWHQPLKKISLGGSMIFGDNITGWSFIFGYRF